jgi:hypothetical protein
MSRIGWQDERGLKNGCNSNNSHPFIAQDRPTKNEHIRRNSKRKDASNLNQIWCLQPTFESV